VAARKVISTYRVCRSCAESGKATWHSFPFDFIRIFDEKGLVFAEAHPQMPSAYRDTCIDKLPSERMRKAFSWTPGEKHSLLLHGTTGCGKTRVAWSVFNRLWLESFPLDAQFLPMRKVDGLIEKGFDDRDHGGVIEYLIEVPLLVLDDLGKERMTQRLESDLFAIIDERTANNKVTIITTNYTSQGLQERFSNAETGPAFIRRLKDYFQAVGA
jgi:DNA replication protein DnaC